MWTKWRNDTVPNENGGGAAQSTATWSVKSATLGSIFGNIQHGV
jgi:hypothetical protein